MINDQDIFHCNHGNVFENYRKISNKKCTKFQNLNVSHLILQLSLPDPLKPGVK